ncbi:TonB C-terminal domain-containing protein [Desulfurispirillum indicum]|uniref:TonB C-terminal domain-containing protein n=1 Tax=Desulfurispirillum indicum TaxID=936456 RepID=UPI001CFBE3DC|nr:TonB C-terminal domain-containing protein [Desulfurispirillum indicum]UCZ55639.1 TonB C-terminal domain-containing protein [Desulfurispirillum indicum]
MLQWITPLLCLRNSTAASVALHGVFILIYALLSLSSSVSPPVTPNIRVHLIPEVADRTTTTQATPQEAPVIATSSKQASTTPPTSVQPPAPAPDVRQQAQAAVDRLRREQESQRLQQQTQQAIDRLARQQAQTAPTPPAPPATRQEVPVAPPQVTITGNSGAETEAQTVWDMSGDREAISYLEAITAIITEHFKNRIDLSVEATRDPVVRFSLSRDGHIIPESLSIRTSSGSQIIDRALILAVQRGNPYMPFPASIPRQTITIDVRGNIHD